MVQRGRTRTGREGLCFDCHSNQVTWPWYSCVAPVSWVVRRHVDGGRRQLNFSTWDKPQHEAREATEEVQKNERPPNYYLPLHAEARLSDAERQVLMNELRTIARTTIR